MALQNTLQLSSSEIPSRWKLLNRELTRARGPARSRLFQSSDKGLWRDQNALEHRPLTKCPRPFHSSRPLSNTNGIWNGIGRCRGDEVRPARQELGLRHLKIPLKMSRWGVRVRWCAGESASVNSPKAFYRNLGTSPFPDSSRTLATLFLIRSESRASRSDVALRERRTNRRESLRERESDACVSVFWVCVEEFVEDALGVAVDEHVGDREQIPESSSILSLRILPYPSRELGRFTRVIGPWRVPTIRAAT